MDSASSRRAIVSRRRLLAALDALAADRDVRSAAARPDVLQLFDEALKKGRDEIRRRFESGRPGPDAARDTAFLVDQLLRALYDFATRHVYRVTNPTEGERLSVVAVGGYGRGEMAPYSDIDLLFLHPYKLAPWGEQVIEYMLYILWDVGLKVGQAIRSVDGCLRLAKSDVSIRTSILEARFVWGDQELYDQLRYRFQVDVVQGSGSAFVEAKLAERDARHKRLGDSRYLVEPNVKDGKGGLRDLHTLFWIGKYLYGVASVDHLVDNGVLTTAELRRFRRSEAFLWTVRFHLHYLARRPEERLTFDLQPEISRLLRYRERGRTSVVERFMKHYFLVAKNVGDLTRIFCAAIEDQQRRKPRLALTRLGLFRRDIDGFVDEGGRLSVVRDDHFAADPVRMIALFRTAQEYDRDIHPHALQLVTRNLRHIDRVRRDPVANGLFLEMLTSKKNPETALRRMNEAGVLGRFVPDFGRVVAQMQHDMYHVYTVDEHTIRAIGILSRIENGALKDDHPLATEIVHQVLSRRVLYLAVLLHDIAKGRGGDHSTIGSEVADSLCPRLGLSAEETEAVAWLVRHHLAMSHTAFKRDIHDPKTIADFKELVQSPERLRLLLVLTVADIRAVGPGRWNGWKGELLRDLYYATAESLSGGTDATSAAARIAAVETALRQTLSDWDDEAVARHVERFYRRYWTATDLATQVRHARLMRRAGEDQAALFMDHSADAFRAVTEFTVFTADHPGLFARLAGAIAASGANIVDARIHTTADGMAIDTFWLQGEDRLPFDGPERIGRLQRNIALALAGRLRLQQALHDQTAWPTRTQVFTVAPRVLVDNNASNVHTVIEVNARDRTGLLYDLTRALSDLGLTIASAHITTFGERAVDVFYVKDIFGLKITHEGKLERVRSRLLEVLTKGHPAARAATAAE
ncbi:MAG: [protein-PII] uridylyltransferase [Alphaproteobacteria bacterium]|nr:[protein-PII] uridylyltransferase [Alphaproteobacteria bacterium]